MRHPGISDAVLARVLADLPVSEAVVRHRQETARVLWTNPDLCESLDRMIGAMKEITVFAHGAQETDRPLLEVIWRLGELELYVTLLRDMVELLEKADALSPALQAVLNELKQRDADPAIEQLRADLPGLRRGIKLHQSVTIGVNLDDKLRPVEAALLGVHAKRFREGHFLSGFLGRATGDPYLTATPLIRNGGAPPGAAGERVPLAPLFEELDAALRPMLRPLARKLRDYTQVNTDVFRRLYPEISFFLGAIRFMREMEACGYPVSFPDLEASSHRTTSFTGLYNLRLASHWAVDGVSRMIGNDLVLDDAARIFVLTGPNGGGKTTFTQAVGIAAVLGQHGLPVPAASGSIAPVDTILTHFPVEEDFDDEIGRFEDEARRVSELFDEMSDRSLVLLNEPLASTSPKEAESIAESILNGLCVCGARGVFTTHFHSLARNASDGRDTAAQRSRVGTLNAGVRYDEGRAARTYVITSGPPGGSSFAEDVARRYRIDSESLRERLVSRISQPGS